MQRWLHGIVKQPTGVPPSGCGCTGLIVQCCLSKVAVHSCSLSLPCPLMTVQQRERLQKEQPAVLAKLLQVSGRNGPITLAYTTAGQHVGTAFTVRHFERAAF